MLLSLGFCNPVFQGETNPDGFIGEHLGWYHEREYLRLNYSFSTPVITRHEIDKHVIVRVNETNHNRLMSYSMSTGKPVLPVNITVLFFPFTTRVLEIKYDHSTPENMTLPGRIAFGKAFYDSFEHKKQWVDVNDQMYHGNDSYPSDWVAYHKGAGLSEGNHVTFLVLRIYPVLYYPGLNEIRYVQNITVNITYQKPAESFIKQKIFDLLVLTPKEFYNALQPLKTHKEKHGVKTKIVTLDKVYEEMFWHGRDKPEKIKYFIKDAVENWGVKYVLLVGGLRGQTFKWRTPVRYSQVVPELGQEYPEQSFLSDLYYADVYNSEGGFSSWDSNDDNRFSVWNETFMENMDLYPDVYLGRIPCRNIYEVKTMVDKIITYENTAYNKEWFNRFMVVAGDSYNDVYHFNEGELISEKAIQLMPGFEPVRVYALDKKHDINRQTVNEAMNQGAGFAYFCGHGSPASWNTHYPPDGKKWAEGYQIEDMFFLKNRGKQPVTIVGGCHNGQFDVNMFNILQGVKNEGLHYFSKKNGIGRFWHYEWVPNCWAWWLTSKPHGGAIATIANTGLGTHGEGDMDNNSIPDYLEVLDGWLELRFLELFGIQHWDILGMNHGQAITEYIHKFKGDESPMDTKMVQQWALFGDPSLKIGGYPG